MSSDGCLAPRIGAALDGLLRALALQPVGTGHYRAISEPPRFDRVFGGQLLAQALVAASATVVGKEPASLHACFVEAGASDAPVDLVIDPVRDGRSMSTRRVTVVQDGRTLLAAIASFHANAGTARVAPPVPPAPAPEELPRLQDWARRLPPELRVHGRSWIDQPPPLELRIGEAPTFLGGSSGSGPRSHWMRLPRDVGDSPLLHSALLAYASDYLLLDMAFRSHPHGTGAGSFTGFSLDHAIWIHRPTRFDRWHLHTQETVTIAGDRGLVRGTIHDVDGHLVATVMQEVLVRSVTPR